MQSYTVCLLVCAFVRVDKITTKVAGKFELHFLDPLGELDF